MARAQSPAGYKQANKMTAKAHGARRDLSPPSARRNVSAAATEVESGTAAPAVSAIGTPPLTPGKKRVPRREQHADWAANLLADLDSPQRAGSPGPRARPNLQPPLTPPATLAEVSAPFAARSPRDAASSPTRRPASRGDSPTRVRPSPRDPPGSGRLARAAPGSAREHSVPRPQTPGQSPEARDLPRSPSASPRPRRSQGVGLTRGAEIYRVYGRQPSKLSPRPRKADPPRVNEHGHVHLHDIACATDAVFAPSPRQLQMQTVEKELLREVYELQRREETLRAAVRTKDERVHVLEDERQARDARCDLLADQNEVLHNELTTQQNEFFRLDIENSSLTSVRTELEEQLVHYKTAVEEPSLRGVARDPLQHEEHQRAMQALLEQLHGKERENKSLREALRDGREPRSPPRGRDLGDLSPERDLEVSSPEPPALADFPEDFPAPLGKQRTSRMLANWLSRPRDDGEEPSDAEERRQRRRRRDQDARRDQDSGSDDGSRHRDAEARSSKASESSAQSRSVPSERDVQHALDGLTRSEPKAKRAEGRMCGSGSRWRSATCRACRAAGRPTSCARPRTSTRSGRSSPPRFVRRSGRRRRSLRVARAVLRASGTGRAAPCDARPHYDILIGLVVASARLLVTSPALGELAGPAGA